MKPSVLSIIDGITINRREIEQLPANIALRSRAKSLRKAGNLAEVVFWLQVRNKTFFGIDFDRQRIIGNYIVDFYVKSLGLVVEIDGASHNNKEDYDFKRQLYLENLGLIVYRIEDVRVKMDCENVMTELKGFIIQRFGRST